MLYVLVFLSLFFMAIHPARASDQIIDAEQIAAQTEANIERYRSEIEALIGGRPSIEALQKNLPPSLHGPSTNQLANIAINPEDAPAKYPQLLVFISLSMPDEAIKGWMEETSKAGGSVLIRGFYKNKLSETISRVQSLAPEDKKQKFGVQIDPTAFVRLDVDVVPTIVILAAPLNTCATPGCVGSPPIQHDRIAGNITLAHGLERLARGGDVPDVAERYLATLAGNKKGGGHDQ